MTDHQMIHLDHVSAGMLILTGLIGKTWRFAVAGDPSLLPGANRTSPAVYCFWHESLLPLFYRFRHSGLSALVSPSTDGRRLGGVLERWGYRLVRGSSSHDGQQALELCVAEGREGRSLVITPDGPRGPARQAKSGVARIALLSGVPVIPAAATFSRCWRLSSWDRFIIPAPFSTITIHARGLIRPEGSVQDPAAVSALLQAAEKGMSV